jgi:hypothetical protein
VAVATAARSVCRPASLRAEAEQNEQREHPGTVTGGVGRVCVLDLDIERSADTMFDRRLDACRARR